MDESKTCRTKRTLPRLQLRRRRRQDFFFSTAAAPPVSWRRKRRFPAPKIVIAFLFSAERTHGGGRVIFCASPKIGVEAGDEASAKAHNSKRGRRENVWWNTFRPQREATFQFGSSTLTGKTVLVQSCKTDSPRSYLAPNPLSPSLPSFPLTD